MKRTLFFLFIVILAACSHVNAPQLALEFPEMINDNPDQKEYLLSLQDSVNLFARQCAQMTQKADKYRDKTFEQMSAKQQTAMVKLDLDYAAAWYNTNARLFDAAMKLTKTANDDASSMNLYIAVNSCLMEVNRFVDELAKQYGQDLKLDTTSPFYREVPDRPQTPTVEMPAVQDSTAL